MKFRNKNKRIKCVSDLETMTISTVIGENLTILGDVCGSGSVLRVDGRIEGDIRGVDGLILGAHGSITGDIDSAYMILHGTVQGQVSGEEVVLRATSHVTGDISAGRLDIEHGAVINGQINMDTYCVHEYTSEDDPSRL